MPISASPLHFVIFFVSFYIAIYFITDESCCVNFLIYFFSSSLQSKLGFIDRIGTEHEEFGFELGSLRPLKCDQIAELLNSLSERFDWEKVMEGDHVIGLEQVRISRPY